MALYIYVIFSGMNPSWETSVYVVNMPMKSRNINNAKVEIKYVEKLLVSIQIIGFQNCYLLESNIKYFALISSTITVFSI
jgi:hypothetical protein